MPRRITSGDQLADAVRDAIPALPDAQAIPLRIALDAYMDREPNYRQRVQRRAREAGQQRIGWTVRDMADRAGVDLFAAERIVRGLLASGRVVRVSPGRYLDAEKAPPIRLPKPRTVRLGGLVERLESA